MKQKSAQKFWLLKTEPTSYSIDDLKRDKKTLWTGVRNYQARNFMRDMAKGDVVLFYHSGADLKGVYGEAKIIAAAIADPTAFDTKDSHYDPKSTKEQPIWLAPEIAFAKKFPEPVPLGAIKLNPKLDGILVASRGSRLSVQPVSERHFNEIVEMAYTK